MMHFSHSAPLTRRQFAWRTSKLLVGGAAFGLGLVAPGRAGADEPKNSEQEAPSRRVSLGGIELELRTPRVVAETAEGHCWYPDLLRFSTGELMLNHSLNADANTNAHNSQAVYISTDEGRSFPFAYDVNGFHNGGGEPRVALPDGTIVGTSTFLKPTPDGQRRRFAAHRWIYAEGGRRYTVEPWGAVVEGLPRDVAPYGQDSRTWWSRINWFSDIVPLESQRWITTLTLQFDGDPNYGCVALASNDLGRTWRYLATIASAKAVPGAKEGFDEPCLVRLENGDLMCISRVGAGQDQKLARTYSADGGKTWSPIDRLPAWSVAPQICRVQCGVLALSTGRPGIYLWVSGDGRGTNWQSLDVMAHHNASVEAPWKMNASQTTAYTAMSEAAPDRIFLVYDRTPFGWQPVSKSQAAAGQRSRIYWLEVNVRRA